MPNPQPFRGTMTISLKGHSYLTKTYANISIHLDVFIKATLLFTGSGPPTETGAIFSDATSNCASHNGDLIYSPMDIIQNAVVRASLAIWVTYLISDWESRRKVVGLIPMTILAIFQPHIERKNQQRQPHFPCFLPWSAEIQVCLLTFSMFHTFICWSLGVPT